MKIQELVQNKETEKERYYREERFDMIRDGKGLDYNYHDRRQTIARRAATDCSNRITIGQRPLM